MGTSSAGVPKSFAKETIVVGLNDKAALADAFEKYKDKIAAVIIEPVPANNGLLLQTKEYLQYLREICTENGTLLVFDEVISGFRLGFEGAAGYYDIQRISSPTVRSLAVVCPLDVMVRRLKLWELYRPMDRFTRQELYPAIRWQWQQE